MADDQQNPYTLMGMMGMMTPNQFMDPKYKNSPLPLPGFRGAPTDAMGKPIQSFADAQTQHDAWDQAHPQTPGTTLNTAPQWDSNGNANAPGSNLNPMGDWSALAPSLSGASPQQQANYAHDLGLGGTFGAANSSQSAPSQANQSQSAPSQANPIDMRQAYLDALANPGTPAMGGAKVPESKPLGTPNVMDAFLSQHTAGGKAGNYDNSEFFNTLKQLRSTA